MEGESRSSSSPAVVSDGRSLEELPREDPTAGTERALVPTGTSASSSARESLLSEKDIEAIADVMLRKMSEKGSPSDDKGTDALPKEVGEASPLVRVLPARPKEGATVTLADLIAGKSTAAKDSVPAEKEKGLVYICDGIMPIPVKLAQAIEKGEFIDFVTLLPKTPSWDEEAYTEISEKVIIISQPGRPIPKKKTIKDIETWMEAFCNFAAVKGKKFPQRIPDLLAYAATIVKAARDYGGKNWLSYDYRFRQMAAAKNLEKGWGVKDMALWNEVFIKPRAIDSQATNALDSMVGGVGKKRHGQSEPPPSSWSATKKAKKGGNWKSQICYPYSYSGKCSREKCDYLHICYDCGEGHSKAACPKSSVSKSS